MQERRSRRSSASGILAAFILPSLLGLARSMRTLRQLEAEAGNKKEG
tara:strand:+ start:464 stop:604 length:141 start_codon:yes stop_codon:yes gene_type:complete